MWFIKPGLCPEYQNELKKDLKRGETMNTIVFQKKNSGSDVKNRFNQIKTKDLTQFRRN